MKTIATLLLLTLCLGCLPNGFRTNTDLSTKPEFSRILIVSKLPQLLPDYLLDYVVRFPDGYDVCTLEAGILAFGNPDSLILAKRQQCNSQVMLTIQPYNDLVVGTGRYATGYTECLLEMTDLATGKPFWKAIASVEAGRLPAASTTINQLRTDGIITGNRQTSQVMTPASR